MNIVYLLQHPVLSGGNKVVFQHAHLLQGLGHRVRVVAGGPPPEWTRLEVPYLDHAAVPAAELRRALGATDLVIATYWTTVPLARSLGLGPLAHFCQGYEGYLDHLRDEVPAIEAVYSQSLPTLTVSPHLAELLARRFGRESRLAPPVVDERFRPVRRWRPRPAAERPWIVVPGIFEAPVKGVPTALAALAELRRAGVPARLLRISPFPVTEEEEELLAAERYLCAVSADEVAAALRQSDLLLFPSRSGEGFGLPVLEAMASGLPVVASRIPSLDGFAGDAVERVPPGDPRAFAAAAATLLGRPRRWRAKRRAGLRRARELAPARVAPRLEAAVRWAAERAAESASAGAPGSTSPTDQGDGGGGQAQPEP